MRIVNFLFHFFIFYFLGEDSSLSDEEKEVMKTLTESLHLNLAACYLKTEKYDRCIASCTTAIATNENSTKGMNCFDFWTQIF
jgi:hypothetical protein